ncbi:hypothetical protein [Streptomyces sp. NRRL B-24484]|uniref:hypothetical protein n=1 Tax=Streptomyces sp. NRRL B-24484 TaxID=1463833 RepID=UPI000AD752BB|nr:hypothetical protein [Streptomyces sp. NRRL B-24484]
MTRRPRPARVRAGLGMAGWLFADMLLVLALVAMGDQGDPVAAERAVHPSLPASPHPGASTGGPASPSPTGNGPRGVEHDPVTVRVSGDEAAATEQIRAATEAYRGRQAAVVLTFGSNRDPGLGQAYAHTVNGLLPQARPEMFAATTTRDFISLEDNPRHASLEIYFYTR